MRQFKMQKFIAYAWNYIFNADVSPLRHIPDPAARHYALQVLGLMWAISFSIALGSYTIFAATVIGHAVLIGALAITAATYTTASVRPEVFLSRSGRRADGEHE
jgi:hypothetical protein